MRVVVEAEPSDGAFAAILTDWRNSWGAEEVGGGIELVEAVSLSALLDLRQRCFGRSVTLNLFFPDNQ
jgi:hypothetical protein